MNMTEEFEEILSPSRIEGLLEIACAYNVPLFIAAESRGKTYRYKSRMLEVKKTEDARSVVIDHPVTDGPAIALSPNVAVVVFFAVDKSRFFFDAQVQRKTLFALASHKKVPALEISYPNAIKSGQRRAYFRVPVPLGKPIAVEVGAISGMSDWLAQEPGTWNFPSHVHFEGRILNISVGGMLLSVNEGTKTIPRVGTKLGLRFSVAPDETPIMLKGIIRRKERRDSAKVDAIGIEFIDTAEKFEYKLAINRLYRYVAERQREMLKPETK
ncbi:PilZ domain-containing protein [Candidatus Poribacteria bacterium]|nr:PilZ domain-containing protein [Candidatus Poribacteria bacterium]